jgi:hypothetical protein
MLQGDHKDDVKGYLVKMGFNESAIEVQWLVSRYNNAWNLCFE